MPGRGVDLLGIREARDGTAGTVLTMACDCGTVTEVELLLGIAQAFVSFEFAYTCDGCKSSHWMRIEKEEEPT